MSAVQTYGYQTTRNDVRARRPLVCVDSAPVIRVAVVDDHPVLRAGIRARLAAESDIAVVAEAATCDEAVAQMRTLHPDVVLLDLLLPTRGGCETIPELLRHSPKTRVLMVSSQASPGSVRRALAAGASGYVSKRVTDRELLTAIRQVAAGAGYVEPELGARLVADPSPALGPLSVRERDVLQLLALGHTNQEIAKRLYISVRTVDTHRAQIMRKLSFGSRAELVMWALANGMIGP
jgi:DNA-binding NarL/FixJ family response regulator